MKYKIEDSNKEKDWHILNRTLLVPPNKTKICMRQMKGKLRLPEPRIDNYNKTDRAVEVKQSKHLDTLRLNFSK